MRTGLTLCALALALTALLAGCGSTRLLAAAPVRARTRGARVHTPTPPSSPGGAANATPVAARITPIVAIELYQPLAEYKAYVYRLLARLRPQLRALHTAAARRHQRAAERDWLAAHVTWLEIGQDDDAYGAFGHLGEQIDGSAGGLPGTTSNPSFTGFHEVELDLWRRRDMPAAAADAKQLVSLVRRLTRATVANDLPNSTLALDGWVLRCHEILEDALRDSLTQNDDYGSNSDLTSLAADVTATREMLIVLAPLLEPRVPKIVTQGSRDLIAIDAAIQSAGGPETRRNLAQLPLRQRQTLDQATGAALETLAPVSELTQAAVPGS
jgi:iron uptake system EfeUOB component EfeO/EfeM